ncbi:DUF423 domain-containing protein [Moraxella sp. VT-16-12]|uniref:DUF423 domain-containing protein n=1 Tax=Moraxella sp. VT-16-12 TaxID=2014877 RepID=UPI000B7E1C65|nr:DUF423 domain-containing protein [Moraxella sp. VT-16-12]TWV84617.1 DUF423 domain-containing protein [Moraxella sp. VT-16-12]
MSDEMDRQYWLKIAGLNLAIAVALGAFGAHGLKKMADSYALQIWDTATLYLFVHGLGLLALGVLAVLGYRIGKIAMTLQVGIIIFSGTLYLMALGLPKWLGAITPIGGTMLIIGWLLLCFMKLPKDNL